MAAPEQGKACESGAQRDEGSGFRDFGLTAAATTIPASGAIDLALSRLGTVLKFDTRYVSETEARICGQGDVDGYGIFDVRDVVLQARYRWIGSRTGQPIRRAVERIPATNSGAAEVPVTTGVRTHREARTSSPSVDTRNIGPLLAKRSGWNGTDEDAARCE